MAKELNVKIRVVKHEADDDLNYDLIIEKIDEPEKCVIIAMYDEEFIDLSEEFDLSVSSNV